MLQKRTRKLAAFLLALATLTASPLTMASDDKGYALSFVEFHWVDRENATLEEAEDYCAWVRPIAAKHGALVEHTFMVQGVAKGSERDTMRPDVIFVYHFPNPEAMQALQSDQEYQANIENRDRIFDFSVNRIWRVKEAGH